MAEFRAYAIPGQGIPGTTLQSIPSIGPYDADSGVPYSGGTRGLSNKYYNIRADAIGGASTFTPHWSDGIPQTAGVPVGT